MAVHAHTMQGMIERWLANGKNQCWRRLLIAVAAPYGGGNPALAEKLLKDHSE